MIKKYIINKAGKRLIKRFSRKPMSAAQKRALAKAIKASAAARRKTSVKAISKRKIKRLAKLKTRIKTNQQALKSISGKNTVFRLQNKKGQGPLMKRVVPPKRIASMLDSAKKPFPVQRHQNIKALRKSMPDAHFEYLDFKRGESFGFKNIKQAEKWFNKQDLKTKALVSDRIWRLEKDGNMGKSRALAPNLFEFKWRNGLRVYFCFNGKAIILLLTGGNKNAQKRDIEKAKRLKKKYTES